MTLIKRVDLKLQRILLTMFMHNSTSKETHVSISGSLLSNFSVLKGAFHKTNLCFMSGFTTSQFTLLPIPKIAFIENKNVDSKNGICKFNFKNLLICFFHPDLFSEY